LKELKHFAKLTEEGEKGTCYIKEGTE